MKLVEGVYENLINGDVSQEIEIAENENFVCLKQKMDNKESAKILADYLAEAVCNKLDDDDLSNAERVDIVNRILEEVGIDEPAKITNKENLLTEVLSKVKAQEQKITDKHTHRPTMGFRSSALFTGGNSEVSMEAELQKDICSADEICIIVSFLRLAGISILMNALRQFCKQDGHRLRVITTTYCGITEEKALKQLSELPNTEIKISYDTRNERLHAKSYIFFRNSGLHTAYIGSSNLSKSALTDGLEWNIRVTNIENEHIIEASRSTFELYWHSPNFEDFAIGGIEKFRKEMKREREEWHSASQPSVLQKFSILPHQNAILSKLKVEREENGLYRNLVVAATGTGKTVISAFDYQLFKSSHTRSRLLFVAHREEILKQSRLTYCSVLRDANFGELWTGRYKPVDDTEHLFITIQTLTSQFENIAALGPDYFDYIVVDEAHHSKADSYRKLFDFFRPQILLGLTATPERADGQSLLPDFGNRISAEIRLPAALEAGLLSPFHYFCITDNTDLSSDALWNTSKGAYDIEKLSNALCKRERMDLVVNKLSQYISDEHKCRALCFCTDTRHAKFVAETLSEAGFNARWLTKDTTHDLREQYNRELREGTIQYLCVVDIFNEGIDIPAIDTVLFLRPTASLTIFLQQLGRGLRLYPGKEQLTVLDFVAQVHRKYNYGDRFRALCKRAEANVAKQVAEGFTLLPPGCVITMEEIAQRRVLENITSAIYDKRKLVKDLQSISSTPTLSQFLLSCGQDIRLIYRNGFCWSALKRLAGKLSYPSTAETALIEKGLGNLIHHNSRSFIHFLRDFAEGSEAYLSDEDQIHTYDLMLYYALFQKKVSASGYNTMKDALRSFRSYPFFMQELREICDWLISNLSIQTIPYTNQLPSTLELYGCYTREEVFTIFHRQTEEKKMQGSAAGLFKLDEINTEIFFVTLNKSEKDFSPTTQYKDYLIDALTFHWQSQNTDAHNNQGRRYVEQSINKKKFVLFVRENKSDAFGNTSPFYCFGLIDYVSSYGDRPMSIVWRLENSAMPKFLKVV